MPCEFFPDVLTHGLDYADEDVSYGCHRYKRKEPMRKKLLVIDDDREVRQATRFAFERDFDVLETADEKEALRLFDEHSPEVVFLDIVFHGIPKGWEILKEIRKRGRKALVVLVTALASAERNPLAGEADGFFAKPFDIDKVNAFLAERGVLPEAED